MGSNNFFKSDLHKLHNITQASMLVYPKEVIISLLRDFFSKDSYYHFEKDPWGFANTTDHTNKPQGFDLPVGAPGSTAIPDTRLSTRLFIGENYRYDGIYYPAILVKSGGGRYVPVSMNRDHGKIEYEDIVFEDGYGNSKSIRKPMYFVTSGAYEGSFNVEVITRSLRSRDDLIELIAMCFTDIHFDTLQDVGIVVKPVSWSAPIEGEDRSDKLFRQSITLDVRTEWERKIPIGNIIESIVFMIDFQDISNPNSIPAANLTIKTEENLLERILEI